MEGATPGGDVYDPVAGEWNTVDANLEVADVPCEVTSAGIESYDDRTLSITLSEDGFEEYIREFRLQEFDDDARAWLDEHADDPEIRTDGGRPVPDRNPRDIAQCLVGVRESAAPCLDDIELVTLEDAIAYLDAQGEGSA